MSKKFDIARVIEDTNRMLALKAEFLRSQPRLPTVEDLAKMSHKIFGADEQRIACSLALIQTVDQMALEEGSRNPLMILKRIIVEKHDNQHTRMNIQYMTLDELSKDNRPLIEDMMMAMAIIQELGKAHA